MQHLLIKYLLKFPTLSPFTFSSAWILETPEHSATGEGTLVWIQNLVCTMELFSSSSPNLHEAIDND
jgi:hypothetical protein